MNPLNAIELKIPPPIVALTTALLMWFVTWLTPSMTFAVPARRVIAGSLFLVGLMISIMGVVSFKRARTTVNPMHPDRASSLVTAGIYKVTRNPMYLGLLIGLVACSIYLSNAVALVFLPLFVLYMNRFQIRAEERALADLFGDEFAGYRLRVRRWL
ncbi:MAG TPA: isoprenylcysteine carboxylmethyltransferase family protein [Tepidisphaeraceae bacterium]|nr:isoprenylcysteine carboxylmethyltransferase family protein [Tepidisphaeraceae bacterium]